MCNVLLLRILVPEWQCMACIVLLIKLNWMFLSVRRRARKRHLDTAEHNDINKRLTWKIHICSQNNFPTAAGLASSAAGLACLGLCCLVIYISAVTFSLISSLTFSLRHQLSTCSLRTTEAGMAHSVCGCMCGWHLKLRSLVNTCRTWAPSRWIIFSIKHCTKCPVYFTNIEGLLSPSMHHRRLFTWVKWGGQLLFKIKQVFLKSCVFKNNWRWRVSLRTAMFLPSSVIWCINKGPWLISLS